MKSRRTTWMVLAFVAATACSTLRTSADWDRTKDFSKYKTWAWKDDGSIKNDILAKRIQKVKRSIPPVTGSTAPVMYRARSEQRNAMACATSSGSPSFCMATRFTIRS